ncbi:unnamed protein product [Choristocarpus tenellus]
MLCLGVEYFILPSKYVCMYIFMYVSSTHPVMHTCLRLVWLSRCLDNQIYSLYDIYMYSLLVTGSILIMLWCGPAECIQVPLVSWMLDTIIRTIEREFFTTVGDHASEFDKGLSTKREDVQVWEKVRRKHSIRGGTGFLTSHVSPVEEVGPKRDLKKGVSTLSLPFFIVIVMCLNRVDAFHLW